MALKIPITNRIPNIQLYFFSFDSIQMWFDVVSYSFLFALYIDFLMVIINSMKIRNSRFRRAEKTTITHISVFLYRNFMNQPTLVVKYMHIRTRVSLQFVVRSYLINIYIISCIAAVIVESTPFCFGGKREISEPSVPWMFRWICLWYCSANVAAYVDRVQNSEQLSLYYFFYSLFYVLNVIRNGWLSIVGLQMNEYV